MAVSGMDSHIAIESKTPLHLIPGIGSQRAGQFEKLGLKKAIDLLFFFPRTYQDVIPTSSALDLKPGTRATVHGFVVDSDSRYSSAGKGMVGILVAIEGGGYLRCVWFNQPFRRENYPIGTRVLATGSVLSTGISFQMRHPEVVILGTDDPLPPVKPLPIYPLTEGLQQRHIVQAVSAVLPLIDAMEEALPESIRQQAVTAFPTLYCKPANEPSLFHNTASTNEDAAASHAPEQLLSIHEALRKIHQPANMLEAEQARARFVFQELFVLQLAMAMHRHQVQHSHPSPRIEATPIIHARILKRFPFSLTNDQSNAIEEIRRDMAQELPMNRLVQGDVGTGKTAIAQYAMLNAVASQYQAAFMVPTELLARQHFQKLTQQLQGSKVMMELLVGSIPAREKTEILQRIAIGTVDIVVGTQALVHENVAFERLGLLVIDEQHRFGVQQRAMLRSSRTVPHYLVMTATPIPRTLAMTVFGDLDVSILKQRPPGQSVVHTYISDSREQDRWWRFVIEQVRAGRQAYVVAPRVETSDDEESIGAIQVWENLRSGPLRELEVDLLHGRMLGEEKQAKLDAFNSGKTQVLVATTVIEVGIDIPNASIMTILDADRLGMAQLHQLRGRVGRGKHAGYVCLFPRTEHNPEEDSRLKRFAETQDGFALAELDLQLRGPGELLGTKQTGLPSLRIADIVRDADVLSLARTMAGSMIGLDPLLALPEHAKLRRQVVAKHGSALSISDVG
jgi:ATP-dependent DNA helicase RecG